MKADTGPKDLPQFEDRLLYHLVELTGDRPLQIGEGVRATDLVGPLAEELDVAPEIADTDAFFTSGARGTILAAVHTLEKEGLVEVIGQYADIRPTRDARRHVAQWREKWARNRSKQDREVQRLILQELESHWRDDPEMHNWNANIDIDRFCEKNSVDRSIYLANAHRLLEQGKVARPDIDEAGPDTGQIYVTEAGRKTLEVTATVQRPQRDAQEAWVEVARLRRRLQIAERSLPSLIADDELRRRCEDLLAADAHHDRVVREACVILEDRVRKAIGASKNAVGTSLMERAFSPKSGLLRLSEEDQEQLGAMQIYRGVMAFFRNAAGHNIIETYSQDDALRFVVFTDLLLATVGKASEDEQDGSRA